MSERRTEKETAVFPRPRLIFSRCLGFAACRWNGETIRDSFVQALAKYADFMTPCPEADIGLGVPRDPVRIVRVKNVERLIQPSTGNDYTGAMASFSVAFLDSIQDGDIDGFILKERSPSCGMANVRAYFSAEKDAGHLPTTGMFAREVVRRFPDLPVESEGRLLNFRIREQFLSRVFTLASFRKVREAGTMRALVEFQAKNKELLRLYSPAEKEALGQIVANSDRRPAGEVIEEYGVHLSKAMKELPERGRAVNVLEHMLGFFSDELTRGEKAHFLDQVDLFREGRRPLSACVGIIQSWAVRFGTEYLLDQTFLMSYPPELVDIADSGKGRDL